MRTFHCILFTGRTSPPALALIMAANTTNAWELAVRELHATQATRVELREGGKLLLVKTRRPTPELIAWRRSK